MPKEIVYGSQPVFGDESAATSLLEVSWSKEAEYVQIGSRIVHGADHSDYVPTDQERPDAAGVPISGLFMSLDRAQINKLIRDLRRARDQAFGRDE